MKNVVESQYLTSVDDMQEFFSDDAADYFECGQGYYQDEAEVIVKIDDKFYKVNMLAEICSEKQDRGDRLYFVESVESIQFSEMTPLDVHTQVMKELIAVVDAAQAELDKAQAALVEHIKTNTGVW